MNEDPTKELQNNRSFEARVFAHFDALDRRLQVLEARSVDTKPIWERALAEIVEVKNDVREVKKDIVELKTDVSVLKTDVSVLKADVSVLKADVSELKTDVSVLKTDVSELKTEMAEVRRGLDNVNHKFEVITEDMVELRSAQRRLRNRMEDFESRTQ